jgi:iron complex transport system ATP-binding protein
MRFNIAKGSRRRVTRASLTGSRQNSGPFAAPSAADREAADEAIATLGIGHLAGREWLQVSGGERQLVLVARALAQKPRILVLDEPTASLDFSNQVRVLDAVRGLAETRALSVLLSTHDPEQAFACTDRAPRWLAANCCTSGLLPKSSPPKRFAPVIRSMSRSCR